MYRTFPKTGLSGQALSWTPPMLQATPAYPFGAKPVRFIPVVEFYRRLHGLFGRRPGPHCPLPAGRDSSRRSPAPRRIVSCSVQKDGPFSWLPPQSSMIASFALCSRKPVQNPGSRNNEKREPLSACQVIHINPVDNLDNSLT